MPVESPDFFQPDEFNVAVATGNVDGAGKRLSGEKPARSRARVGAAMPADGVAAHAARGTVAKV